MIKKFEDLKIDDPIYIIMPDGKLIIDTVILIRAESIGGNYIDVNIKDLNLKNYGSISISHSLKNNFSKTYGVSYSLEAKICSDYKVALMESIVLTKKVLEEYTNQLYNNINIITSLKQ